MLLLFKTVIVVPVIRQRSDLNILFIYMYFYTIFFALPDIVSGLILFSFCFYFDHYFISFFHLSLASLTSSWPFWPLSDICLTLTSLWPPCYLSDSCLTSNWHLRLLTDLSDLCLTSLTSLTPLSPLSDLCHLTLWPPSDLCDLLLTALWPLTSISPLSHLTLWPLSPLWPHPVISLWLPQTRWSGETLQNDPIMFCDFMERDRTGEGGAPYKVITDARKLTNILEEFYLKQNIAIAQVSCLSRLVVECYYQFI